MSAAPAGAEVRLFYDAVTRDVRAGDELVTSTTGRRYLVLAVRRQERGKHVGRMHLRCVVLAPEARRDPDTIVHPVTWYRRHRAR